METQHADRPSASGRVRFRTLKMALAPYLCNPLLGFILARVLHDHIPHRGCTIDTSSPSVTPTVKAMLFWGTYEAAETRFVQRYLRSNLDVVELGSSLGVLTSHITRRAGPDRRIVCLEANPALLDSILVNVNRNSPDRQIELVHGAIHYRTTNRSVRLALGTNSTDSKVYDDETASVSVQVPATTLGELLSLHGLKDYALVCDIEGAEVGIIELDAEALARCRQLIIELHQTHWQGRIVGIDELRQRLQIAHGFDLRDYYGPVCLFERS